MAWREPVVKAVASIGLGGGVLAGSLGLLDATSPLDPRHWCLTRSRSGPPIWGSGTTMLKISSIRVLHDGKPIGVLTRQDLLGFLAT